MKLRILLSVYISAWCITTVISQSDTLSSELYTLRSEMMRLVRNNELSKVSTFYSVDAEMMGDDGNIKGIAAIKKYWAGIRGKGVDWSWEIHAEKIHGDSIIQSGISHLTLAYSYEQVTYSSSFEVVWLKHLNGIYKIVKDHYKLIDQFRANYYDIKIDSGWITLHTDTIFVKQFKPISSSSTKFPGIYLLQGGGNVGIENYFYEAELFAKHGIAAIVCDKAGSGKSKGKNSWITQTFQEKLNEYSSILHWFSKQTHIDSSCLGIHGPSEGGRLALDLALQNQSKIKFVNAVSAPLISFRENQLYAIENIYLRNKYDTDDIKTALHIFDQYFLAIKQKNIPQELIDNTNILRKKYPGMYLPLNSIQLPRMPRPEDIDYTLGGDMEKLTIPVYFQYGAYDHVVHVKESIKRIPQKTNFTIKIYNQADHSINLPNGDMHGSYTLDKLKWILHIIQNKN